MVKVSWVWKIVLTAAFLAQAGLTHAEGFFSGTGFVISSDGYILTCNHVVKDADDIGVVLPDGRKLMALYVDGSEEKDLALLKVDADNLTPAELGDSDKAEVTDEVMALGYPLIDKLGADLSVSSGTINSKRENTVTPLFQIDLVLNPGNSGGPLLNSQGEVIGVAASRLNPVVMLAQSGNMSERVNFAVPINEAGWLVKKAFFLGRSQHTEQKVAPTKREILAKVKPAVVLVLTREKSKMATIETVPVMKAEAVAESVNAPDPREKVRDFLQAFIASWESKPDNSLGLAMVFYAFPVSPYFDEKSASKEEVRKEFADYWEKWPERHYRPIGKVTIEMIEQSPAAYRAQYSVEFDVRNSTKQVKGVASYDIRLEQRKPDWFGITSISEKILQRRTVSK